MKCERCGKELSGLDLYCERCGKAVFPEYMDEADIWAYYKTDEELAEILKAEEGQETKETKKSLWEAALLKEQETEAESLEPEAESETEVPEPETKPEPEISEAEPEIQVPDAELEPEVPELEVVSEAEVLEPDAEPEVETEPDAEHLETAQEETEEKEPQEETEDISEQEEWDFSDDDDEEEDEDEVPSLTPEMKKARRWKRALISLFLILCLGAGIFLGFHRIKKMEQQEKEYYKNIEGNTKQEAVSNEVPAEIPEEEKDTEPSEEETPVATEPQEEPIKEEEPKEEPKQEYFKLVNADEIDFSKYQKLSAASTEENSVKESESYDYSAKSAVDGDVSTSWQENEEGVGEGKGFQVTLDGAHKIRYVVLHLGNWRSDQLWDYNARPKTLTIQVGDQQVKDVEFSNEKKKFCLSFDEPVEASYISLYIKEAYEGSRWQDNCISEVELYE
ncbi:MAG: discoidin domain-containing protein [Blautia sp.]|nr:discoidin domain-containing protein [Blautia sp.]